MDERDNFTDSTDGRIERAKDSALGKHDSNPSHVDEAGEAVGGLSGVLTGAAIGTAAGPIGTIIGGIAGAVGGWWAGRAVTEAAANLARNDDEYYRAHYESSSSRFADRPYEDVRPAYHLGHIAAHNPDYANKSWTEVSKELHRGWSLDNSRKYGDWSTMSHFANEGFMRGRSTLQKSPNRTRSTSTEKTFDRTATHAEKLGDRIADKADDRSR